jgi:hypothetical protein
MLEVGPVWCPRVALVASIVAFSLGWVAEARAQGPLITPSDSSVRRSSAVPGHVFAKEPGQLVKTKDRAKDLQLMQPQPLTLDPSDPRWGMRPDGIRRRFQNENPQHQTARFDGGPGSRDSQLRAQYVGARNLPVPRAGGYMGGQNSLFFGFPIGPAAAGTAAGGLGSPFVLMGVR